MSSMRNSPIDGGKVKHEHEEMIEALAEKLGEASLHTVIVELGVFVTDDEALSVIETLAGRLC